MVRMPPAGLPLLFPRPGTVGAAACRTGIHELRARIRDGLDLCFLMLHIPLDRVDEIRDEVSHPLSSSVYCRKASYRAVTKDKYIKNKEC